MTLQPQILLANADKWLTESLESVLMQGGYTVIITAKRQHVLELARRHGPDGILLDMALDARLTDSLSPCPSLRAQQLEALRAGAWELRGDPLDMEELVLRLSVYVQGKLEVDRLGAEGMVDRVSGLYNDAGMSRRSAEIAAFTARQGLPLACAVFQPADGVLTAGAADRLALAMRRAARISDAVGRTGPAEFTVFAPATDEEGAEGLTQRILDAIASSTQIKLRAGMSTAPAVPRRPSGARSSSAGTQQLPSPPSTTELLEIGRDPLRDRKSTRL